jgi:hypothetical protein
MEKLLSALEKSPVDTVLVCAKILCRIPEGEYIIRLANRFFRVAKSPFRRRFYDLDPRKCYDWFAVYDKGTPEWAEILEKLSRAEALPTCRKVREDTVGSTCGSPRVI